MRESNMKLQSVANGSVRQRSIRKGCPVGLSVALVLLLLLFATSTLVAAADLYTLKSIKVVGNAKVKEAVIVSLLPFHEGEQYTKDGLKEQASYATRILRDEKIFFSVNVFPFFSEETMECKIIVDITGEWTYQFGLDVSPLYFMIEDRAFLGNNDSLGLKLSKIKQEVYFVNRRAFGKPLNISVGVYNQTKVSQGVYDYANNLDFVNLGYYSYRGYGGYLGLSYKLNDQHQFDGGLKLVKDTVTPGLTVPDPVFEEQMGFYPQDQLTITGGYKFTTRSWDSYDGITLDLNGGLSKLLNDDLLYAKGTVGLRGYKNLFGLKGAIKVEYGLATDNIPYYKRFNLNSISGVRGSSRMVPGTHELLLKSEVLYPIFAGIQGVAFYDAGTIWNTDEGTLGENFRSGYGLGLRYTMGMPVNTTFRLEWAINKGSSGIFFVTGESF